MEIGTLSSRCTRAQDAAPASILLHSTNANHLGPWYLKHNQRQASNASTKPATRERGKRQRQAPDASTNNWWLSQATSQRLGATPPRRPGWPSRFHWLKSPSQQKVIGCGQRSLRLRLLGQTPQAFSEGGRLVQVRLHCRREAGPGCLRAARRAVASGVSWSKCTEKCCTYPVPDEAAEPAWTLMDELEGSFAIVKKL
jgi:hypothetical protein